MERGADINEAAKGAAEGNHTELENFLVFLGNFSGEELKKIINGTLTLMRENDLTPLQAMGYLVTEMSLIEVYYDIVDSEILPPEILFPIFKFLIKSCVESFGNEQDITAQDALMIVQAALSRKAENKETFFHIPETQIGCRV